MRVLTGAVMIVALAIGVFGVAGCAAPGSQADPAALQGPEWTLTTASIGDVDVSVAGITVAFDGKQMSGFSGVNQYGGGYEASADGTFKPGMINSTLMAGPENLMAAEQAYLGVLQQVESFSVENDTLTLTPAEGEPLTFAPAPEVSLPGSSWTVTAYNNGKQAVVSPIEGSELTLEFGTDGSVSGNSGVNTFRGTFEATDDTVAITGLASTKMAGEPDLMEQETAYLKALENATTWNVTRGSLDMRDGTDASQVQAVAR